MRSSRVRQLTLDYDLVLLESKFLPGRTYLAYVTATHEYNALFVMTALQSILHPLKPS
jgi:hypothetical protein